VLILPKYEAGVVGGCGKRDRKAKLIDFDEVVKKKGLECFCAGACGVCLRAVCTALLDEDIDAFFVEGVQNLCAPSDNGTEDALDKLSVVELAKSSLCPLLRGEE